MILFLCIAGALAGQRLASREYVDGFVKKDDVVDVNVCKKELTLAEGQKDGVKAYVFEDGGERSLFREIKEKGLIMKGVIEEGESQTVLDGEYKYTTSSGSGIFLERNAGDAYMIYIYNDNLSSSCYIMCAKDTKTRPLAISQLTYAAIPMISNNGNAASVNTVKAICKDELASIGDIEIPDVSQFLTEDSFTGEINNIVYDGEGEEKVMKKRDIDEMVVKKVDKELQFYDKVNNEGLLIIKSNDEGYSKIEFGDYFAFQYLEKYVFYIEGEANNLPFKGECKIDKSFGDAPPQTGELASLEYEAFECKYDPAYSECDSKLFMFYRYDGGVYDFLDPIFFFKNHYYEASMEKCQCRGKVLIKDFIVYEEETFNDDKVLSEQAVRRLIKNKISSVSSGSASGTASKIVRVDDEGVEKEKIATLKINGTGDIVYDKGKVDSLLSGKIDGDGVITKVSNELDSQTPLKTKLETIITSKLSNSGLPTDDAVKDLAGRVDTVEGSVGTLTTNVNSLQTNYDNLGDTYATKTTKVNNNNYNVVYANELGKYRSLTDRNIVVDGKNETLAVQSDIPTDIVSSNEMTTKLSGYSLASHDHEGVYRRVSDLSYSQGDTTDTIALKSQLDAVESKVDSKVIPTVPTMSQIVNSEEMNQKIKEIKVNPKSNVIVNFYPQDIALDFTYKYNSGNNPHVFMCNKCVNENSDVYNAVKSIQDEDCFDCYSCSDGLNSVNGPDFFKSKNGHLFSIEFAINDEYYKYTLRGCREYTNMYFLEGFNEDDSFKIIFQESNNPKEMFVKEFYLKNDEGKFDIYCIEYPSRNTEYFFAGDEKEKIGKVVIFEDIGENLKFIDLAFYHRKTPYKKTQFVYPYTTIDEKLKSLEDRLSKLENK